MQHTKRSIKKIPPIEIQQVKVIDLCWAFYCCIESPVIGIVFHCKHNLIHSYIQSLNPILKILKFKYLQIRHKPCNQLATKAQSFPRKSSNTASPMIARHAKDFTWNRGCSSNSPPLKHGDQIPHPLEDSDNQIPSSPERQRCQMPGVCPGGCWSFDLTDTLSLLPIRPSVRPFVNPVMREFKLRRFWVTHVNRTWTFALLSRDFKQMFAEIVSIRVKTLNNTNLVASRQFKIENGSLPVDVRRSKTSLLKLPIIITLSSIVAHFSG